MCEFQPKPLYIIFVNLTAIIMSTSTPSITYFITSLAGLTCFMTLPVMGTILAYDGSTNSSHMTFKLCCTAALSFSFLFTLIMTVFYTTMKLGSIFSVVGAIAMNLAGLTSGMIVIDGLGKSS